MHVTGSPLFSYTQTLSLACTWKESFWKIQALHSLKNFGLKFLFGLPFLCRWRAQFTGQSRFGVKMEEEKKESIFSLKYCVLILFPTVNPNFPPFFVLSLSLFLIYHFNVLLGGWIEGLHVQLLREKSEIASPLLSNIYKSWICLH